MEAVAWKKNLNSTPKEDHSIRFSLHIGGWFVPNRNDQRLSGNRQNLTSVLVRKLPQMKSVQIVYALCNSIMKQSSKTKWNLRLHLSCTYPITLFNQGPWVSRKWLLEDSNKNSRSRNRFGELGKRLDLSCSSQGKGLVINSSLCSEFWLWELVCPLWG